MKSKKTKKIKINDELFEIIDRISNEHCRKTFGYLDKDDLKNEIWTICLEKIEEYDSSRGNIEHFLRVSVKNRLVNRFKDITKSVRSPCHRCPYYDLKSPSQCAQFGDDKYSCKKWRNYQLSIESRNSLLNASEDQIERSISDNKLDIILGNELKEFILQNISNKIKKDFEDLVSGSKISKQKIKKLRKEIIKILKQNGYQEETKVDLTIRGKNA
jgi:uncharacterized protein YeeX (DUF496 family)